LTDGSLVMPEAEAIREGGRRASGPGNMLASVGVVGMSASPRKRLGVPCRGWGPKIKSPRVRGFQSEERNDFGESVRTA
jgi:hypothetical protein